MDKGSCSGCGSNDVKKMCTHCKEAGFCSTSCYVQNRIKHKEVCTPMQIGREVGVEKGEGGRRVRVVGKHTVKSQPDTFVVDFRIDVVGSDVQKSGNGANEIYMSTVTDGIMKSHPKTLEVLKSTFGAYPNIIYPKDGEPYQEGFKSTYNVAISSSVPSDAGSMVSFIMKEGNGQTSINDLSFVLRDDEEAYVEALRIATDRAIRKIGLLARQSKADAWTIVSVEEDGASSSGNVGNMYYESRSRSVVESYPNSSPTRIFVPNEITPSRVETTAKVYVTASM